MKIKFTEEQRKEIKIACDKMSEYLKTPLGQADLHIMTYQIKKYLSDKRKKE